MTDEQITPLPTAERAMRYAVELAADPLAPAINLDRARTWVAIAAELRAGAAAAPGSSAPPEWRESVERLREAEVQAVTEPPTEQIDIWQQCVHCGYAIDPLDNGQFVHRINGQQACPVVGAGTYAQP